MANDAAGAKASRFFNLRGRALEIFGQRIMLPQSRLARIGIGCTFLIGGCLAILPVFGVWMLPLGFLILSMDIAMIRRWRRRAQVRHSRWRARRLALKASAALRSRG
ncbi:hypothetical protein Sa4125_18630 [Aureimonas sp. SA4125]|uniref:hypothetical protein n=1 Tax=Aureimonas sp. SA4125 TaxID=2826993 RepID=UPI001CC769F5|nr:hypothetical protein [Aureimonas sp. SA4125]BDA84321.1 hypothetical protein Sa4125_18630 [Aureimonas sp. SA4125]